ncbi:hypothetical protein ACSFBF_19230 [Variovorax sp. ZT5P49]|uniref:hypothetical protein n=1 Tax=Variovorax sp. ZT5P49 TaxID=3443733 RepID=UPI003F451D6C
MSTGDTSATTPSAATPLARRGSLAAPNDEARQQVAWQREMERAQMATWFKPPVTARPGSTVPAPSPAPSAPPRHAARAATPDVVGPIGVNVPGVPALPGASLTAGMPMVESSVSEGPARASGAPAHAFAGMRAAALVEAAPEARAPADAQIRRAGGPVQHAVETMPDGTADTQADAVAEPRSQTSPSTEAQAPLRLHEEAMPEGQAVWIAMRADDDALAAMLPRIVSDLQRDMQQARGQRLHQVVCNGRLVWRDGTAVAADSATSIPGGERRPTNVFDSLQSKGA